MVQFRMANTCDTLWARLLVAAAKKILGLHEGWGAAGSFRHLHYAVESSTRVLDVLSFINYV